MPCNPGGRSLLIVDGARRASLRDSFAVRSPLTAGEPVEVVVELPSVAITIPAGHCLGALVAASDFDRYDRNPQDGSSFSNEPGAQLGTAEVSVPVDADHPSLLELPVAGSSRPPRRRLALAR